MTTVGARRSTTVLVAALSLAALTVALLQTAVVPVLGIIAHQLDVSSVAVSWAVTANLLAAAAATPLIGRLADLQNVADDDLADLTTYSAWKENATLIVNAVTELRMPADGPLDPQLVQRIQRWAAGGQLP